MSSCNACRSGRHWQDHPCAPCCAGESHRVSRRELTSSRLFPSLIRHSCQTALSEHWRFHSPRREMSKSSCLNTCARKRCSLSSTTSSSSGTRLPVMRHQSPFPLRRGSRTGSSSFSRLRRTSSSLSPHASHWVCTPSGSLRVPGLSYPEAAAEVTARTRYLDVYEAMRLFMGRARRVAPSFVPTAHDEYEIARLCRLLAGSPLGIELASGWLSVWSPRAIADEIERDLDFLVTDAEDVPARHRSLRQVFEHSVPAAA